MSTSPFLASVEQLITESHRQIVRARATHPDLNGGLDLDLEDVTITWDETTTPRVNADMTVKVPDDLSVLNVLDPRTGVRTEIDCGYILPGGEEEVQRIADLMLRTRSEVRPDNTLRMNSQSDESLMTDASPAATGSVTGTSHADAITKLIKDCISPAPKITATVTGAAVTVDPVTDKFNTANDLADRINAKVYDDGLREWFIKAVPTVGTPDLSLTIGENGTVTASDSTIDRDNWHNYVFLRYKWTDNLGVDKEIRATALVSSGPYAVTGPAGKKILIVEREVQTTQSVANEAAASILKRELSRANSYTISAVAAYWLRPGMTVAVKLKGATAFSNHIVARVVFRPLDGLMEITTRLPDSGLAITTTTPVGAPVDPDPAPPAKQRYVSEWVASSSQAYKGDGTQNTFVNPEITQGYYDGTNQNQRSIVVFTSANSTGDEVAKTITQALTGVATGGIEKVEAWLYCSHSWSGAGGAARLGFYNGTSIPGTFTGGSAYKTESGWRAGTWRWVNITNSSFAAALLAGTARGITTGPGVGSDKNYYMKFNGAGSSTNKPKLRITYSK